jgi:uncharacterized protein YjbJ (UPF0337 family)
VLIGIKTKRRSLAIFHLKPARGVAFGGRTIDKDQIAGSAKVVKGKVKQAVGKAVGDSKLESQGKVDKIEGKVQNAVGGVKDTLRGK